MYKRLLVLLFCLLGGALAGGLAEFEWHFERGSLAVSYTHLDVYKRQAYMYLGDLIEFGVTEQIFFKPTRQETEDYITGRFG